MSKDANFESSDENLKKLEILFFDPSSRYGSAVLRQVVEDIVRTYRRVVEYLDRFVDTDGRRALQSDEGYGNHREQLANTLNLVFDAAFDHGANNAHERFLGAVKSLGLDDGQDEGVDPKESAQHYYLIYRDRMVNMLITKMELSRIAGLGLE